ncbi:nephrin-like isoform X2 [Brachionus plicatilis]|uniref:Nephrin-like isoform X2 n=1 Tax=Brachionus plicatilis TaxID=10195 RepID=A0A3M7RQJ3_BRAPC|nr:nephrin-like isoform X2 [Brachionus plicatilis]
MNQALNSSPNNVKSANGRFRVEIFILCLKNKSVFYNCFINIKLLNDPLKINTVIKLLERIAVLFQPRAIINFKLKILCSCSVLLADQSFTEIARNTTVLQGEDVTLKCTVKNQKGEVFWCRDESFCVYTRKRNMTDPRLSFGGNETLGENHLVIKNASLSDDTKYQCQVLATDKEPSIKSDWAYLTVLIRPSTIAITPNSKDDDTTIRLVVNQTASIECLVEDSNPGCDIVWYLVKEILINFDIERSRQQLDFVFQISDEKAGSTWRGPGRSSGLGFRMSRSYKIELINYSKTSLRRWPTRRSPMVAPCT